MTKSLLEVRQLPASGFAQVDFGLQITEFGFGPPPTFEGNAYYL